jgi:hypothetical protein
VVELVGDERLDVLAADGRKGGGQALANEERLEQERAST